VRSIKSEAEIDKIRFSCRAVSVGLHKLHEKMALLPPGELTERSAAKILRQGILEFGCDDVPYLVAISGNPGYKDIITGPTDRPLTKGDLFVIDVGARFDDYWCDFDRNWSIGQVPNDKVRAAHRLLWLTSEAGIKAALPGVKCSDVFKAMAKVLEDGGVDLGQNNVGRMGHGLGLQLTEWPSIHPDDHTLLEEGMVITIEPGIGMEDGTMLAHEENMVIRKGGVELLTERAPCYIPVVQACTPVTEVRYAEGVLTTRQLDRKDIHGCPRGEPQHADTTEIMMRIKAQLSEVAAFHKTWEGGVPTTPLVPLAPLAKELGLKQVWLKDEGNRSMGGENLKAFKGLGVSWAVERVRRAGGLKQGTTVATMTDGNHGRALAYVAQKMGIPCVVFVPGNMVPARREAIEKYGAKVIIVKGSYDDAIVVVRKEAEKNGWILVVDTAWKGYTDVPLDILVGYTTIFRETEEQLVEVKAEAPVTHVFLQAGVGGFSSAGVAAVHLSKSKSWAKDVKFVIVEPSDADCILENVRNPPAKDEELRFALGDTDSIMAGLNCGQPSILSWPIVRDLASGFVALGDTWPREAVRKLHGLGVVAGESGVAGVAGLQALMNLPSLAQERDRLGLGPDSVVLLISTEADTDPGLYQQILAEDPFMCPGRIANAKL
jgi:diaminopropionate ammonia-lyase